MTEYTKNGEVKTYCRICEAYCNVIAKVEDSKIVDVRANPDHVHAQGHRCKKSSAMVDITYDPDRILQPLKRVGGPGEFAPVSWDEAMTDIAARYKKTIKEYGNDALANYVGNPCGMNFSFMMWIGAFRKALDIRWNYCNLAEDFASLTYAGDLLFGSGYHLRPDIWRSDFVLLIGSNPAVSHGSCVSEPLFRDALVSVIDRGGRVIVVDPRKTETASRHEHLGIIAGTDAWLLGGMIKTIIDADLVNFGHLAPYVKNQQAFFDAMQMFSLEESEKRSGVPAETIKQLALDFAKAEKAVIWGRTGPCQQKFGTLNNVLLHCLSIITGNLDAEGGSLFSWGAIDFDEMLHKAGIDTIGLNPSPATGLPDVNGVLPSSALAPDILDPGKGLVKTLMMFGANPVITSPGTGDKMERALESLDLFVSLDLYINETNRFADYILPACGFYERQEMPLVGTGMMLRPSFYATPAVIPPVGESREEWQVMQELCQRLGMGGAYPNKTMQWMAKLGLELTPHHLGEVMIRTGNVGDWFGLRPKGISVGKTRRDHPDGIKLRDHLPTGVIGKKLYTDDKKIDLLHAETASELTRLEQDPVVIDDKEFPLRMHSQRKPLSHNSWMHNARSLAPGAQSSRAMIHPRDAEAAGIEDGDEIIITSTTAQVQVNAEVTEAMSPGNVALPHGWGHEHGGWQHANALRGVNSNILASDRLEDMEKLAGMSILNGIPINVRRAEQVLEATA